ncbi:MAG: glycosyltransferase family 39 protein, partial [Nitrospinota bacterium]
VDNEETRYALQARQMIQTGDWVVPRWSHRPLGTKPPLFTWSIALVSKAAGGVDEWTARLPSAAAALGTIFLIYALGARLFGKRPAFLASLVLSSSFLFWDSARFARSDMLLTFFVTASFVCVVFGEQAKRGGFLWLLGAFAASGLAILSKGPVGLALPALAGFLYLTIRRRWRAFPGWSYAAGVMILLAVVTPWHVLYARTAGEEYAWKMLFQENVTRYLSGLNHPNPFYFYVGYFPPNFLPWVGLMLPALAYGASRGWRRREPAVLVFVWWAALFLFFSLSTSKRPSYMLPVFPAAALLTGNFLDAEVLGKESSERNGWGRLGALILGVTFAGLVAGGIGFPIWAGLEERSVLASALVLGALWVATGLLALRTQRRRGAVRALGVFVGGILVSQVAVQWTLAPQIDRLRSPAAAARQVVEAAGGAHVVAYRFEKPSLAFYGRAAGAGEGKTGEIYYFKDSRLLGYFLNDFQAPAYVLMQSTTYRGLSEDERSRMSVVREDLPYGKYRTVLLANRPFRPAVSAMQSSTVPGVPTDHQAE